MQTDPHRELVVLEVQGGQVEGLLALPAAPAGLVLFSHGSGSSRHSPRNNAVAAALRHQGFGTLLMDLLTPEEDRETSAHFDIAMLTSRLERALDWLREHAVSSDLPVGLFGASTGAACALRLAATRPAGLRALVARGGRPELAGDAALAQVQVPTLLIVGSDDPAVLAFNRHATELMRCEVHLETVAGASHLFEEPGALDIVAGLAGRWFMRHMAAS